jgi:hypothetical protein
MKRIILPASPDDGPGTITNKQLNALSDDRYEKALEMIRKNRLIVVEEGDED